MSKHLADKRKPSDGGRTRQFLRIDHDGSEKLWDGLRRRPTEKPVANRRAAEYLRIDRGDQV
ncbi:MULTISPECIES: hypothetical protein [Gemmobacter]|uniref:Uncharacterized protein n=2 Tax=Gemmobacter TaxID=204456 RepID=A0A2T6B4U9_9RHOB|nr:MULTISPECIES: hypothetical protein [Gemmobacter]OJY31925.1 MAG: hypothetical protein BGP11_10200 [Rhodobacterales bacterium 65-51]PTX51077.1 hypothetical protein C8N34_104196 [Gemmobacter caeni]TWJ01077.1 hypothetical protein IQ03_01793 [Gemmobacter caeni]GHC18478.1 hypothetical protein GCM10007291_16450 [Gemmobacter nanjingensis]